MVSIWPWKGLDSSPAEFEKILSTLSKKITDTQAHLDRVRSNSRRHKLIWTLYLTFAYLVYAIVLTLVIGWQNMGPWEWTGMAGGPVVIYLIRTATTTYFNWRIDTLETRSKELQTERAKTIQKLKDATKYDSTLELLEKYGGEKRPRHKRQPTGDENENGDQERRGANKKGPHGQGLHPHSQAGRTSMAPPPTANIQRPSSAPGFPPSHARPFLPPPPVQELTAEFAPNAGPLPPTFPPPHYEAAMSGPPRWYDRIMDLMLGEDETMPKNRIVLICKSCRLVNGQAPPGTKSLAELGSWKCMGCGAMNGEMDEGRKIMREVLGGDVGGSVGGLTVDVGSVQGDSDRSSDIVKVENEDTGDENEDGSRPRTRSQNHD